MRRIPSILVFILLGAATTVAIALSLALYPSRTRNLTTVLNINPFGAGVERTLYVIEEHRPGVHMFIFTTAETRGSGSVGPSWEIYPGSILGSPMWELQAKDRGDIEDAMACFPNARGIPRDEHVIGSGPPWPGWMAGIPEPRRGTTGWLAFGGRAAGWPFATMRSTVRAEMTDRVGTWSGSWRLAAIRKYQSGPYSAQDPESGCVPCAPVPAAFGLSSAMWGAAWYMVLAGPSELRRFIRRRKQLCLGCGYDVRGLEPGAKCPECGAENPPKR